MTSVKVMLLKYFYFFPLHPLNIFLDCFNFQSPVPADSDSGGHTSSFFSGRICSDVSIQRLDVNPQNDSDVSSNSSLAGSVQRRDSSSEFESDSDNSGDSSSNVSSDSDNPHSDQDSDVDPNPNPDQNPYYHRDPDVVPDLPNPNDPDSDPDDPEDPHAAAGDNGVDDEDNFNLEHPSLNRVIRAAQDRTAKEILAMILALGVHSNMDYKNIIEICRIINVLSDAKILPSTKDQLWSVLGKKTAGIRRHAYCSECSNDLGILDELPGMVQCGACDTRKTRGKLKYFITLSVTKQLQRLLATAGIWQHLQYRNHRQKFNDNALEDLMDGEGYQLLVDGHNGLRAPFDFTYLLNTDGFSKSKSSNSEAYPIFLKLNEITPALRQKTYILAGIVIDDKQPDFDLFFQCFVREANILSTEGIRWRPDGNNGDEVVSRFFPTSFSMDAKARAAVMQMALYSGHYGCSFCEHPGVSLEGAMKYPMPGTEVRRRRRNGGENVIVIPHDIPLRTDASVRDQMEQAHENHERIRGVKERSILIALRSFDLGYGCTTDDLHPIYLGVTKFLTKLILQSVPDKKRLIRDIDRRLRRIKTPTHISRKPRSLSKRGKWKGSEWRNWLLYFGVPCLKGLLPNNNLVRLFALLSKAIFMLSRDSVTMDEVDEAERCLQQFAQDFQRIFGPGKMRFNVHVLLHVARAVRMWGPLQYHSTFFFESLNGRLKKSIRSPKGAADQIINRHLLMSLVNTFTFDPELDAEVREELDFILSGLEIKKSD